MKALRKRFLLVLTIVMGSLGIIGGIIFYNVIPTEFFVWYPTIPLFFYFMGLAFGEVLRMLNKKTNIEILNIYLILRVSKVILTAAFIALYIWLINEKDKEFVITIGFFYVVYLTLETKFYFDFEKSLKRKKTNEKIKE
jgi:hypothetical protein